jgi:hypothetical protein
MRYNFHEELQKTKENPLYVLPDDINESIIEYLQGIGCSAGAEKVKQFQEKIRYGNIEITHMDVPESAVSIQVDCGMANGYKKEEIEQCGKWIIKTTYSVRNKKLDKKKPERCRNESKNHGNNSTIRRPSK